MLIYFRMFMDIVVTYSIFSNVFYIAFGPPVNDEYIGLQIIDAIVEIFFLT